MTHSLWKFLTLSLILSGFLACSSGGGSGNNNVPQDADNQNNEGDAPDSADDVPANQDADAGANPNGGAQGEVADNGGAPVGDAGAPADPVADNVLPEPEAAQAVCGDLAVSGDEICDESSEFCVACRPETLSLYTDDREHNFHFMHIMPERLIYGINDVASRKTEIFSKNLQNDSEPRSLGLFEFAAMSDPYKPFLELKNKTLFFVGRVDGKTRFIAVNPMIEQSMFYVPENLRGTPSRLLGVEGTYLYFVEMYHDEQADESFAYINRFSTRDRSTRRIKQIAAVESDTEPVMAKGNIFYVYEEAGVAKVGLATPQENALQPFVFTELSRDLLPQRGLFRGMAVTPLGDKVAVVVGSADRNPDKNDLYLIDVASRRFVKKIAAEDLPGLVPNQMRFSPDGQYLLIHKHDLEGGPQNLYSLAVNEAGSVPVLLSSNAEVSYRLSAGLREPEVSSDGFVYFRAHLSHELAFQARLIKTPIQGGTLVDVGAQMGIVEYLVDFNVGGGQWPVIPFLSMTADDAHLYEFRVFKDYR